MLCIRCVLDVWSVVYTGQLAEYWLVGDIAVISIKKYYTYINGIHFISQMLLSLSIFVFGCLHLHIHSYSIRFTTYLEQFLRTEIYSIILSKNSSFSVSGPNHWRVVTFSIISFLFCMNASSIRNKILCSISYRIELSFSIFFGFIIIS